MSSTLIFADDTVEHKPTVLSNTLTQISNNNKKKTVRVWHLYNKAVHELNQINRTESVGIRFACRFKQSVNLNYRKQKEKS